MSNSWSWMNSDLLNSASIQLLPDEEFKQQFMLAMGGSPSVFTPFVKLGGNYDPRRLPASQWAALRARTFKRDNYTCQYCGAHGGRLECDHIKPLSRGGSNRPRNLITACFTCNRSKRNKTLREWLNA